MCDLEIDARRWRFLGNPDNYIERGTGELKIEPLRRQFKTAKNILQRLAVGRGVLLADDVGLGKTTVGALVAWIIACQNKRVRIYAPNEVLRRRWAEELERHVPMLKRLGGTYDTISNKHIRQGEVKRLDNGYIQVATHHALVKKNNQQTGCDLMIIDEAHRAKGDGSAFNKILDLLPRRAEQNRPKRKLILTATPFSINIRELKQLLKFVGAGDENLKAVESHADELKKLYKIGDGRDVVAESGHLIGTAKDAICQIQEYVIRHGIDNLPEAEKERFGSIAEPWKIAVPSASPEDINLLLRMDRLLHLAPDREGKRRNDPRFHIGWRQMGTELERVAQNSANDPVLSHHIDAAKESLSARGKEAHPKVVAVSDAILPLLDEGEKVLVFCHHRAVPSRVWLKFEGGVISSL